MQTNRREEALTLSKEALIAFPNNSQIKFIHAKSLLANELYQDCFDILEKTTILPHEGSQSGRILYRQAAVMQSLHFYRNNQYADAISIIQKARIWPENLGVGKPDKPDQRIEDFLEAEYLLKSGNKEKAEELYDNIITFTQNRYSFNSTDLLYLIILKRLAMNKEIEEFLIRWDKQSANKDLLTWVKQVLYSNKKIENAKTNASGNIGEGTPWDPVYSDFEFELIKEIARNVEI